MKINENKFHSKVNFLYQSSVDPWTQNYPRLITVLVTDCSKKNQSSVQIEKLEKSATRDEKESFKPSTQTPKKPAKTITRFLDFRNRVITIPKTTLPTENRKTFFFYRTQKFFTPSIVRFKAPNTKKGKIS